MVSRTFRLLGKIWGDPSNPASLTVNYDGTQVFSGITPTIAGTYTSVWPWEGPWEILGTWNLDVDLNTLNSDPMERFTTTIPVTLTVNGGDMLLCNIEMNYVPYVVSYPTTESWSHDQPIVTYWTDIADMTDNDFVTKYGVSKLFLETELLKVRYNSGPDTFHVVNYRTKESDGRANVKLNGQDTMAQRVPGSVGDWQWGIPNGYTLSFDYTYVNATTSTF